jgi:hypothetical protein
MNQFIQKVANYIGNEVIIKGLSNSRTFQKFAVRTDASIKEMHKTGSDSLNKTFDEFTGEQIRNAASKAGPPQPPLRGFPGFVSAFFKEIRSDLGIGKIQK